MSDAQIKLFTLMSEFAVETVLGWISVTYLKFGPQAMKDNDIVQMIVPFAQKYFNYCAVAISSNSDKYLNDKFEEMKNIKLRNKNHPIDILNTIVMLSLYLLQEANIKDIIGSTYINNMNAIKCHLTAIIKRKIHIAASLDGCAIDHVHEPICEGEQIFTFVINKYTQTKDGPLKLTNLNM